jgi:hypothetical protein
MGHTQNTIDRLSEFADFYIAQGAKERGLELLSMLMAHPDTTQETVNDIEKLRLQIEAELPPDVYTAAWERGKALDLDHVVDELLQEPA